MASGTRALTLKLIADIDSFTKNLDKGTKEVDTFGDKLTKFGGVAAKAFAVAAAAAAAYAVKIGIEGVKAAIEDEAAQAKLATTLRNATNATDAQIASTEKYLSTLAIQTAKSDGELRPALERLALSTNSVKEAQDLLEVSTRISVNSGVELQTVANAIAKAQDGNTTSLARLGIGLSAAEVKGMSFAEILDRINEIYPDLGANADTLAFKMEQMRIGFDEAKETIGFALLPIMESLINFINNEALPVFNAFIAGLTGNNGAVDGLDETAVSAYDLGKTVRDLAKGIGQLAAVFSSDGKSSMEGFVTILKFVADTANVVVTIIKELISFIIEMSNQVISFLNLFGAGIQKIKSIEGTAFAMAYGTQNFAIGGAPSAISKGGSFGLSSSATGGILGMGGIGGGSAGGGGTGASVGTSRSSQVNALNKLQADANQLQDLVDQLMGVQKVDSMAYGSFRLGEAKSMMTVNFNGIVGDGESVKRNLVELMNDSTARGTLGAGAFNYATDR
jgi:hypothetical protein